MKIQVEHLKTEISMDGVSDHVIINRPHATTIHDFAEACRAAAAALGFHADSIKDAFPTEHDIGEDIKLAIDENETEDKNQINKLQCRIKELEEIYDSQRKTLNARSDKMLELAADNQRLKYGLKKAEEAGEGKARERVHELEAYRNRLQKEMEHSRGQLKEIYRLKSELTKARNEGSDQLKQAWDAMKVKDTQLQTQNLSLCAANKRANQRDVVIRGMQKKIEKQRQDIRRLIIKCDGIQGIPYTLGMRYEGVKRENQMLRDQYPVDNAEVQRICNELLNNANALIDNIRKNLPKRSEIGGRHPLSELLYKDLRVGEDHVVALRQLVRRHCSHLVRYMENR
jgi:chromosome segregation ATPase